MEKFTFEGVENSENFNDRNSIELYRKEALEAFSPMSKFIKGFVGSKKVNIMEIGSGNSSLLFNLNNEKILKKGVGIEMARSRYIFAERWKNELGLENIININDDFRKVPIEKNKYEVFICNSTLQYLDIKIASELFCYGYESLKKDGIFIMDVPNYGINIKKMQNNIYSYKKKFASTNPFSYGIYELKKDLNKEFYINTSRYFDNQGKLKATSKYKVFEWHERKIKQLLVKTKFNKISTYGSLDKTKSNLDSKNFYFIAYK